MKLISSNKNNILKQLLRTKMNFAKQKISQLIKSMKINKMTKRRIKMKKSFWQINKVMKMLIKKIKIIKN